MRGGEAAQIGRSSQEPGLGLRDRDMNDPGGLVYTK